jgi:hypothetical protein
MTAQPPSDGATTGLTTDTLYTEICASVRYCDDVSFKLLGLVPLVSGAALIGFIVKDNIPAELVTTFSLFAASISLGLFRWELRNIQTCSWFIGYASDLEWQTLTSGKNPELFRPRPNSPQSVGKTEAEKLIYATTIVVWLCLPLAVGITWEPPFRAVYLILAAFIGIATLISIAAKAHIPPTVRPR